MKNILVLLVLLIMIRPSKTDLTVTIDNLENDKGVVRILLFNSPDGFPDNDKKAVGRAVVKIQHGRALYQFKDMADGNYAISAFHDENEDGKLNKNLLGVPQEAYGFSNNASGTFGPPSFSSAAFKVDDENDVHVMSLKK
ncbi:DUF2141 domain-containing protein [Litoribacter alkaliphilus]|uniref:DUF2141 domain-containing protein n=1 Tax=Litoribacter ruber TaxID=702568 RepID=A0AAP2CGE6_9BACT|nr:DUF2141 domain-containing protein [Litoribacter alkaliphilus]MBS9523064.1 DUF2141 domain-containing protein [Litoribacter alkaliphilus]